MVGQDAVDGAVPHDVDRILAGRGEDRLEPRVLECLEEESPDRRLVIDDEDPGARGSPVAGVGARRHGVCDG